MSFENPTILYVGDIERGQALSRAAEARGWYTYLPADTMDALAMYITYFPDVVVIDPALRRTVAAEVYMHLRSINAVPLIVLGRADEWHADQSPDVYTWEMAWDSAELLDGVAQVVQQSTTLIR